MKSFDATVRSYCPGGPDSDFEYSTQAYTGYEPTRYLCGYILELSVVLTSTTNLFVKISIHIIACVQSELGTIRTVKHEAE